MTDQDLSGELNEAISELQEALERAAAASARIQTLLPDVNRISSVFQELESVFEAGRRSAAEATQRPTLVIPTELPMRSKRPVADTQEPPTPLVDEWRIEPPTAAEVESQASAEAPSAPTTEVTEVTAAPANEPTVTFRLEFESNPGPLDLRAVDEAVSEHPFVRDVALLDYDGRRATLKVWVAPTVTAAEVQESLAARADQMGNGSEVSIVTLEDVA
jgi:hypothetical protein